MPARGFYGGRWYKKAKYSVGDRPGKHSAKTLIYTSVNPDPPNNGHFPIAYNTRTLYPLGIKTANNASVMSVVPRGNQLNQRSHHDDDVNVVGWRIRMHCRNNFNRPLCWNIAILIPKTTVGETNFPTNFFRSFSDTRGIDADTNIGGMTWCKNPINTDKFFILCHKRVWVGVKAPNGSYNANGRNWKDLDLWIPLRRRMYWENTEDQAERQILGTQWFDTMDVAAGGSIQNDVANVTTEWVTYFRD